MSTTLPEIFILYGPPAAGKGTQAHYLQSILPDYYHLDFGTELRKFTSEVLGNYFGQTEKINPQANDQDIQVARSLKVKLSAFEPVHIADLRYVVEKTILKNLELKKGMIIEGPGRTLEEAKWLSTLFSRHQLQVVIFHLHISLSETVKRSATRYYAPGVDQPFESYQKAKEACLPGQEPYRRPEDEDSTGITQRYELLYADIFAKILSVYQMQKAQVFIVDASLPKDQVSEQIRKYLNIFFHF